jgi:2-polyprenyl-3-methyl-5-hydroxy-6-metoxy-1,4-benzoquinol methylase
MTSGDMQHWENIYSTKGEAELSWHQENALDSLEFIERYAAPGSSVIDVGGGSSPLAASLVRHGFGPCTVIDLSATALLLARSSLDAATKDSITWLVEDLLRVQELGHFDVWHDRAVFHFLMEPAQRSNYVALAGRTIRPGGTLVLATFSVRGPDRCSGLPACRYDAATLNNIFAANFRSIAAATRKHVTPAGLVQPFTYVAMERVPSDAF